MARSTYHDQFAKLVDRGYLVQNGGNGFDFFETPQTRYGTYQKPVSAAGLNFEERTSADRDVDPLVQRVLPEDIQINNTTTTTKPRTNISGLEVTDEIKVPEEKIVYIKRPEVEAKKTLTPKPKKTGFVF